MNLAVFNARKMLAAPIARGAPINSTGSVRSADGGSANGSVSSIEACANGSVCFGEPEPKLVAWQSFRDDDQDVPNECASLERSNGPTAATDLEDFSCAKKSQYMPADEDVWAGSSTVFDRCDTQQTSTSPSYTTENSLTSSAYSSNLRKDARTRLTDAFSVDEPRVPSHAARTMANRRPNTTVRNSRFLVRSIRMPGTNLQKESPGPDNWHESTGISEQQSSPLVNRTEIHPAKHEASQDDLQLNSLQDMHKRRASVPRSSPKRTNSTARNLMQLSLSANEDEWVQKNRLLHREQRERPWFQVAPHLSNRRRRTSHVEVYYESYLPHGNILEMKPQKFVKNFKHGNAYELRVTSERPRRPPKLKITSIWDNQYNLWLADQKRATVGEH